MKRRTMKKRRLREADNLLRMRLRGLDRHDRAYLLDFLRGAIFTLAKETDDVDSKLRKLAELARRLAPAIVFERRRSTVLRNEALEYTLAALGRDLKAAREHADAGAEADGEPAGASSLTRQSGGLSTVNEPVSAPASAPDATHW